MAKLKNPIFAHFSNIWAKKSFSKKSGSVCTTWQGFLPPYQNSEKPNNLIPSKHPDRMDRPYFTRPFQLLLGVQQVQLQ